ncbi:class I SAM-dependent methyltransferase [Novipirellula artificiosorum]|uniref:Bifunctional 3-demethylubiquinone-9 3-methyltransferase/ 2-octaprenyl-6-hydroxy phenol methylase n=1 Tax=Novipirellula artificiosorum TaxID=2528016 RepID=A0A5C6DYV3_9BACT|nr:class I SAM-dependent methyltransferase [Novipirellula artificiosorum]TWU41732.1 bifunctional 3-demethylubiquinone-9 3-methyltransferase/ 2-octaprenyl-6-hydroxy phenol methylase [Novipirellula artificiosorum]
MNVDEILRNNRRVYDAMADAGNPLCQPATEAELANPLATLDPCGWLGGSLQGSHVLCLAAGGGRQSSLYAAAGASVTVVDLSGAMLELDRKMATERGWKVRLFETSMENLQMLRNAEFDLVVQPVSTCYVPEIQPVFRQVARVLRGRGLYISQHKNPVSLQSDLEPQHDQLYRLQHPYYRQTPLPAPQSMTPAGRRLRESGATEFLHRWEQIVGGMCRSGFVIEDLVEPVHADPQAVPGSFGHRAKYVAPYLRIKARRVEGSGDLAAAPCADSSGSRLWLPEN